MGNIWWVVAVLLSLLLSGLKVKGFEEFRIHTDNPFSKIQLDKAFVEVDHSAHIEASPNVLGMQGTSSDCSDLRTGITQQGPFSAGSSLEDILQQCIGPVPDETYDWVTVKYNNPSPAATDWIAVFSPANFNSTTCNPESGPNDDQLPLLCSAPIKFQYANYSTVNYVETGKGTLRLRLINQRADFAFALFAGGMSNPKLLASSNTISFANPKAPLYPRLAQGKKWNEMAVRWTSGYSIEEATPVVEWGFQGEVSMFLSPAGTLTYTRDMMCGQPARTVGWRDPGFIHTSILKDLWPNTKYYYKVGHKLVNGSYIWGQLNYFAASPYPGQDSLQRVIIFGDMGKAERDGSNAYSDYQPGTLNTTDRLIEDLDNIDIVFHIGDLSYANGYISEWDQFTAQVEPIASHVPYMVASGNHERDWPNSGSFYKNTDSGGECGVPAKSTFYAPTLNDAKIWYSTDYGMFHFCIADSELDWQEGTEQYKFIEECLASADRQKQPWLIFISHRVLGYSSNSWLAVHGAFGEPMGREIYQKLWQKYKVDIAFFGHVHNYERSCPVYENYCVSTEKSHYSGTFNATIHVVAGGGGSHLSDYASLQTTWSIFKDQDYGFVKLTSFNHSTLLFEYKRSSDGKVYDQFWITREYRDIIGCDSIGNCPSTTLAV